MIYRRLEKKRPTLGSHFEEFSVALRIGEQNGNHANSCPTQDEL